MLFPARNAPAEGETVPVLVVPESPSNNQLEENSWRRRREAVTTSEAQSTYPLYPAYPYYNFHYPAYPAYPTYSYYPLNGAPTLFTAGVQVN
jgi:hypothetical protein